MNEQVKGKKNNKDQAQDNEVLTFDYMKWEKPLNNTRSIGEVRKVVENIKKTFASEINENKAEEAIKKLDDINVMLESVNNKIEDLFVL